MVGSGAAHILDHVPPAFLALLQEHLPHSISLLRRLQYAAFDPAHGWTSSSRLIVSPLLDLRPATPVKDISRFGAAFLDLSSGIETQMWMYSTAEDIHNKRRNQESNDEVTIAEEDEGNVVAVVEAAMTVHSQMEDLKVEGIAGRPSFPTILVGSLHQWTRSVIKNRMSRIVSYPGAEDMEQDVDSYEKWLVNLDNLPAMQGELPPGLAFDHATLSDCEIAATKIPYPRLPYAQLGSFGRVLIFQQTN
jgi:hypothetical protein